jgi:ADP-ribose pyrophosphatase
MNMTAEVLSTSTILEGDLFEVRKSLIQENGVVYSRDVVVHPGSAVIVPYFDDGSVALVRQYRHPAGADLLELPAGSIEPGETALECAAREVREEVGCRAESLEYLTDFYVSPGFLSEKMTVFLATGLTEDPGKPDSDEFLTVQRIDLEAAIVMVRDGAFKDAKTMLGLMFAGMALGKGT